MNDVMLRITNLMNEKGIKQKELCEKIGINETNFSTWKKSNTTKTGYKKHIAKIAEILNVSVDYLLTGKINEAEDFYRRYTQLPETVQQAIQLLMQTEYKKRECPK